MQEPGLTPPTKPDSVFAEAKLEKERKASAQRKRRFELVSA